MKVLKDTFQQSFELHNYWELKKRKKREQTHTYSHVHINAHTDICTFKYAHTHKHTRNSLCRYNSWRTYKHNFIHPNVPLYTSTDKNLLQLKQNL